jgi:ACS family hexuronate transporter-like MFS transporter
MPETKSIGSYRWTICALVFFATTVNYLDRSVISLLKSTLTEELHWTDADYADIEVAFKFAYALGMLFAGRVIDKLGSKIGYFLATLLWSVAAVAHAFVSTTLGFILVRGALGVTESGNFPAAIKSTAEWFPKKERALATGIFNSGTNIGAIIAPLTVPFIVTTWGWQWAFIITGSFGAIWLVLWLSMYEIPSKHPKVSKEELDYINSDPQTEEAQEKVSWFRLLTFRQTWAFAQILGSYNLWFAVLVIGLATSAHQAWSANIFTTVSDMFPKKAVGSVVGIGGMAGGLGGMLLTALVQRNMFVYYRSIGQIETAYYIMFFICGAAYLLAWAIIHFLVPKFEPIKL